MRNRFKGLDLIECLKNYGQRSVTIYRRQGSRPPPRKRNARRQNVPGANTRDPTPNKAVREKTWRARRIRFSGVSKRPAHEIVTSSRGESLTDKADQVFRDFEKLPPALTLKMISVFLMPASMDYSLISVTQARKAFPDLFPNKNQFRTLINKFPRWWYFMRLFRVKGVF